MIPIKDLSTYNQEYHSRLMEKGEKICSSAGIPSELLFASYADKLLNGYEKKFITSFDYEDRIGVYTVPDTFYRFQLITALFLRNYTNAKMVSVNDLPETELLETTVLLVPDLTDSSLAGSYKRADIKSTILHFMNKSNVKLFFGVGAVSEIPSIYDNSFKNAILSTAKVFQ